MSAVISLSEARAARAALNPLAAVHGIGRVGYVGRDGQSRLTNLYQSDPVRVMFPEPARGDIPSAAFVTTSGGMVGGDRLELSAKAEAGARVMITTQAAEKIYRSNGADCRIDVSLRATGESWVEWLPQETIVFDGARLQRRTIANVEAGSRLLAGEFLVFGRVAMGESLSSGLVSDAWEINMAGELVWADMFRLDDDIADIINHPAGLDGATSMATVVYAADDAAGFLETARQLLADVPERVRVGATVVGGMLLVRFLGADGMALRRAFGDFWAAFRAAAAGLPAALPRLWHI